MITPIISSLETPWKNLLNSELEEEYFRRLMDFVESEYATATVFPPVETIFHAFNACPPSKVKVVLIGQDPYHGLNQAHGLCFSVNEGIQHPPSLRNIFKELQSDIGNEIPMSGNLNHWAAQGVLMLNAILTVREAEAGSHKNQGWEQFTTRVLQELSTRHEGIVFLLWGGFAKKLKSKIAKNKNHIILESGHPSPLSANRGYWFGNRHFSKVNTSLIEMNKEPINW